MPQDKKPLRQEVREQTAGYILAGLGFVAGLAWNEAIKSLIEEFFPLSQDTLVAKLIYALFATVLVVAATHTLLSSQNKK